jgi:carbamoyl-phosphate synthase large subunit
LWQESFPRNRHRPRTRNKIDRRSHGSGQRPRHGLRQVQIAAFNPLPKEGNVFFSVNDRDKDGAVLVARELAELGFQIHATGGTFKRLEAEGITVNRLYKLAEQKRPNVIEMMKNGDIDFIINTLSGHEAREDEVKIRSGAVQNKISHCTNLSAAEASVNKNMPQKHARLVLKSSVAPKRNSPFAVRDIKWE